MSPGSTSYKGKAGQWAFMLHRITGFLIFLFILLHIVDVAMINFPTTYNAIHRLYGNVFLRLFEVGLLFSLLFHSLNGLRVSMLDFFPGAVRNERLLFISVTIASLSLTAVGGFIIMKPFFFGGAA